MKTITILILAVIIAWMCFKLNQQRNTINWYYSNEIRTYLYLNEHYAYTWRLNPLEVEKCLEITYWEYY